VELKKEEEAEMKKEEELITSLILILTPPLIPSTWCWRLDQLRVRPNDQYFLSSIFPF
jgi:hypothetical protein